MDQLGSSYRIAEMQGTEILHFAQKISLVSSQSGDDSIGNKVLPKLLAEVFS